MSILGVFGDVVFEVSADKIRTFDEFNRTSADRWEAHEIIGQKPKSEFIGPGLDEITFTMRFDANLGVNPRNEMERLLVMSRKGEVAQLSLGGKLLGVAKWKIKNLEQKWTRIDNLGRLLQSEMNITIEEYV